MTTRVKVIETLRVGDKLIMVSENVSDPIYICGTVEKVQIKTLQFRRFMSMKPDQKATQRYKSKVVGRLPDAADLEAVDSQLQLLRRDFVKKRARLYDSYGRAAKQILDAF